MPIPHFFSADKIGHLGMYGVLELLFLIPLSSDLKAIETATILAFIFSALTEIIQHFFIDNRVGELGDLIANSLGLFLGYWIIKKRIKS